MNSKNSVKASLLKILFPFPSLNCPMSSCIRQLWVIDEKISPSLEERLEKRSRKDRGIYISSLFTFLAIFVQQFHPPPIRVLWIPGERGRRVNTHPMAFILFTVNCRPTGGLVHRDSCRFRGWKRFKILFNLG